MNLDPSSRTFDNQLRVMDKVALAAELSDKLDKLVENLTTSGQPELDRDKVKDLKNICKLSDEYVRKCFHATMIQLEKEHSEIRLSAVQVADILFNRSHCFRDLLLGDFQYFMELTIETDPSCPLPPPKPAAKTLKTKTTEFVHIWHDKFGDTYKKLALGYNYLKSCRKVDFQDVHARSVVEQQRIQERAARTDTQHREKLQKALDEMAEMTQEVKSILTQAENCLRLLLPDPESFQIDGLKSPDIFPSSNPWKEKPALTTQRHVNKSTKAKVCDKELTKVKLEKVDGDSERNESNKTERYAEELATVTAVVKTEKGDNDFEKTNFSPSAKSGSRKIEFAEKQIMRKCDHEPQSNAGTERTELVASRKDVSDIDVKPDVAELQKAIRFGSSDQTAKSLKVRSEAQYRLSPLLSLIENSNDSGEFHEISDEESEEESGESEGEENSMREHGFNSQAFSISVNMVPDSVEINETMDNEAIVSTLRDSVRLMDSKFLPCIQKWLEVFAKRGAEQSSIKRALDIRQAINNMKEKVAKLKIVAQPKTSAFSKPGAVKQEEDSDEDNDDFEEVSTKEGYEPRIPDHLREEYGLVEKPMKPPTNPNWEIPGTSHMDEQDPTTSQSTLRKLKEQFELKGGGVKAEMAPRHAAESGAKKVKYENVPVVPFNMDLYHWGEKLETPLMVSYLDECRFWTSGKDTEDTVDVNALASMKSRVINFAGKFEPVKWSCRTPLSNGKLCPRMDRYKCPFHGKVIPRDDQGQPMNQEDKVKVEQEEARKAEEEQAWDDPELQADILAATGVDLTRKGKGKKGKGKKGKEKLKKYPGLTDLKRISNPVRRRLERKVLSQGAISRVATALDVIEDKRRKDKFGNTFHYVHGPRKTT